MFRTYADVTRPAANEQKESISTNRTYICDFCSEGWSSETEVEIHRSISHSASISLMLRNEYKPICKMCMTEFADEDKLLRHIKSMHLLSSEDAIRVERNIFICSYCGDIFFNKLLLIHHISYSHMSKNKNSKFKCPNCLKNTRLNTCWYHFLQHKLQSIAVCKICVTKFKDRLTLGEHIKCHPYEYRCDTCNYDTKKKALFDEHINRIHKKPDVTVEVINNDWMKYFVRRKQDRTWHRINLMGWKGVRLTNDIHICILCREICEGVANMQRHILVDHMGEQSTRNNYQCSCGMVFSSKVLYKHHLFKFKEQHDL